MENSLPDPQAPPRPTRRLSGLAVASLCLALVPHAWWLFVAPRLDLSWRDERMISPFLGAAVLCAVILGFMADSRIPRSGGALKGRTLAWIATTLAFIAGGMVLIRPPLLRARESTHLTTCHSNLKSFATVLLMYSADNGGLFPPDLQTLVHTGYAKDISMFRCPSVRRRSFAFDEHDVDRTGDYCYGMPQSGQVPPDVPVVWERALHRDTPGCYVCFAAGHVAWDTDIRKLVEDNLRFYATPPDLPPASQ